MESNQTMLVRRIDSSLWEIVNVDESDKSYAETREIDPRGNVLAGSGDIIGNINNLDEYGYPA